MRMIKKDFMIKNDFIEKEDLMVKDGLKTRYTGKRSVLKMLAMAAMVFVAGMWLSCAEAYAGTWQQEGDGTWYYQTSNGRLTGWHWIDGNGDGTAQCYCFDPNGRMKAGTTVDGWQVNADGAWVQNGALQTQQVAPGTHYAAGSGSATGTASGANGASSGSTNVIYAGGTSSAGNAGASGTSNVIYAGGAGSSGAGSIGSGMGSTASGGYTPERARAEAVPSYVTGTQAAYHGKVWTSDDYYVTRHEDTAGKLNWIEQCLTPGCYNPRSTGSHCEINTCREPGCTLGVAMSEYNAGYCYQHMKAHGIDAQLFAEQERAQRSAEYQAQVQAEKQRQAEAAAARAAAEAQARAAAAKSKSSGSSSGSGSSGSSSGSGKSGSSSSSGSKSSSSSSGSSGKSSSSSSKKSTSYYDSYDDGYDDVYYNEWYDQERYRTDWDYMSGVDDAMDDLDEDW